MAAPKGMTFGDDASSMEGPAYRISLTAKAPSCDSNERGRRRVIGHPIRLCGLSKGQRLRIKSNTRGGPSEPPT